MSTLATLSLTPGPQAVPQALAWLESVADQQQWAPRTAFKLSLCLDEALTNIVMHGFRNDDSAKEANIDLSVQIEGPLLALEIIDNGTAFDPTQTPSPELADSLDDAHIGGHGLRLMRHYLQDIQYQRDDGKNRLRLMATSDPGSS